MSFRRKLAGVLAAAALTSTLAGTVTGTAQATPHASAGVVTTTDARDENRAALVDPYAGLYIRHIGGDDYEVTVYGKINATTATPYYLDLAGEDTWFDDTPVCHQYTKYTDAYGHFSQRFTCPGSLLDENLGKDEIYAKLVFFPSGRKSFTMRSNTVTGYF